MNHKNEQHDTISIQAVYIDPRLTKPMVYDNFYICKSDMDKR